MSEAPRDVLAREREFFQRYYGEQTYQPFGARLRLERERARILAEAGGRLGRVLSVGCGDGAFEVALAPHAGEVVGIDLAPAAIERATEAARAAGAANVSFRCQPAQALPDGERFDTVVCLGFLHHLPAAELAPFLARMRRHVAPGGFLYAQDPNVHGVLRAIGRRVLGDRYHRYHSPDERELDPAEVVAALHDGGFRQVRVDPVDLTLTPGFHMFARGPDALMRVFAAIDRLWCATPLGRWASGFAVVARP